MMAGASRFRFSQGGSAPPRTPPEICASRRRFAVGGALAGPPEPPPAGLLGGSAPQDPPGDDSPGTAAYHGERQRTAELGHPYPMPRRHLHSNEGVEATIGVR